ITICVGFADPGLLIWAALVLLAFAIVNLLLARMIFAWVERWLAQRRAREIIGVLFFLFILSFQLIGPLMNRYGEKPRPGVVRVSGEVSPAQGLLAPGLAAGGIARMSLGQVSGGLAFFGVRCL